MLRVPPALRPWLQEVGRLAHAQGLRAHAVGGCVRDWLLRRSDTPDVDLVIEGDAVAFARQMAALWNAAVSAHEQFGTATLSWDAPALLQRVDFATCRKETYREPAAYPKVTAGTLEDDLRRRDFTINAMAMALSPGAFGRLVDPFGGTKDLRARRLRILHARSFIDDPSRILRAARFLPRFRGRLDAGTARELRSAVRAGVLDRLNLGRARKELRRMLEEPDPAACLACLGRWVESA
ncbi:MAG: CCA tRNA nucleotidyltransferase [Candidatus Omnitrophica bacterium]|nr:CCA tRNA nucleotidyltransferase [Candidatus Omnitrophota bacterium]